MANDAYEVYFAEKLWELLPAVYRDEDGYLDDPGLLRAVIELVADQAARLRRSQDRLWDDSFVELCDDWAVSYLGDLVGTRPLSALNPRGRRIDVAKTIYYRRRKGTPFVLEELIVDITGWEGVLREGFRSLARSRHGLDPAVPGLEARFSRTPPGGFADIRDPRAAEMTCGAFDEFAHTPDFRAPRDMPSSGLSLGGLPTLDRHRGALDTAGIRKVGFHIFRLGSYGLQGVRPAPVSPPRGFTLDPSGRDVQLFQRAAREKGGQEGIQGTGFAEWRAAEEWELPAPMRCRVLGHAEYSISSAAIDELTGAPGFDAGRLDQLRSLIGHRLPGVGALRRAVGLLADGPFFAGATAFRRIRGSSLQTDCGKSTLIPGSVAIRETPATEIPVERVVSGVLTTFSAPPAGYRVTVDPVRGRLQFRGAVPADSLQADYRVGMPGDVGAGPYPRPDVTGRPATSTISGGGNIAAADFDPSGVVQIDDSDTYDIVPALTTVRSMTFQSRDGERPYVRRGANWVVRSGQPNSDLLIDGVWLGSTAAVDLRLRGSFRTVRLVHCTLDPGGPVTEDPGSPVLPAIRLVVAGEVDRLTIDRCIVGRIVVTAGGEINRLVVRDSIVQAPGTGPAIRQPGGETVLERVTVLGDLVVKRLYATEALISGSARALDTQAGCFRYSAAGAGSRLPRPYQSHVLDQLAGLFTSRRYGNPGFAQISLAAPAGVRRGAENGSEIGAFSAEMGPIRFSGLRAKAAEYMPFGLVPFFIAET